MYVHKYTNEISDLVIPRIESDNEMTLPYRECMKMTMTNKTFQVKVSSLKSIFCIHLSTNSNIDINISCYNVKENASRLH